MASCGRTRRPRRLEKQQETLGLTIAAGAGVLTGKREALLGCVQNSPLKCILLEQQGSRRLG